MPGTVTSKWTLDTSEFDAPLKRSVDLTTASGRAIEQSARKAAEAQALAAKLGADAISEQTLRVITARKNEAAASADVRKAQALNKAGYLDETSGANLEAAALQRLAAAKLHAAEASRIQSGPNLAQSQATAAKFAGDAVTSQSLRIAAAMREEQEASRGVAAARAAAQSGYLSEAEAARTEAAALQRLTAAKVELAEASKVSEGSGISSIAESLRGVAETLLLFEAVNKLREAVTSSLEFGEAMQRASEKTGLTVETLSTLHYAAAVTGGDFDGMSAAVAKMDKTIGAATEGNKKAQAFLKSLGLNATDLASRSDGAEIAFKKFAVTIADTENPIRRVELATGLLGKAGAESIPTLIELGENWDEFRKKASDAGELLDSKTAEQLAATQKRLKDLEQSVQGAGLAFTKGFIPGFNQMLDVIADGKGSMDVLNEWGSGTIRMLAAVTAGFYGLASGAETAFGVIEALTPGLGDDARKDLAAAKELNDKAVRFRDIAMNGPSQPKPQLGDDVADFLDRNHLGGRERKPAGADPFGGIGDLGGAANKAAQERLHAMEAELNQLKLQGNLSIKWEYDFWTARMQSFEKGSSEYNAVVAKAAELAVAGARAAHEKIVKFQESLKTAPTTTQGNEIGARYTEQRQHEGSKAIADSDQDMIDSNRLAMDQARNQARQREAELTDAAGRSMTKYDAAIELSKVHATEFAAVMEGLHADLDIKQYQQGLTPTRENAKAVADAQAAIAVTVSQRTIQARSDDEAVNGRDTSPLVGASDAIRDFVNATRDGAAQMRSLVTNTLNSVNAEIVRAISTRGSQRQEVRNLGAGVFRSVAGTALQKGEGAVLGALGLGGKTKPTGARGDALHVLVDNPAIGGTSSALPLPGADANSGTLEGLLSSLLPGSSPSADSAGSPAGAAGGGGGASIGSGITKIVSTVLPFLPGFADGGVIAPNTWAMVGERGPEPFFSGPAGGTVIPNHKAGSIGGGDTHNWNIDASGSNDPAAVEAAVQRGLMAAAPHIASLGVMATREQRMRVAPSRRG